MEEILKILKRNTDCSFTITVNDHKTVYQTVEQYFKDVKMYDEDIDEEIKSVKKKMVDLDTIIYLHWYKDTPVGFHSVYTYSFGELKRQILEIVAEHNANIKREEGSC